MAGKLIEVLKRTPFDWKAVPQGTTTGAVVIQNAVPVVDWREISLLIRVHAATTGNAGSLITVFVSSVAPSLDDPSLVFATSPIASIQIATGTAAGTLKKLEVSPQGSTPVNAGAFLLITAKATGATSGATDVTATLSMDLCVKGNGEGDGRAFDAPVRSLDDAQVELLRQVGRPFCCSPQEEEGMMWSSPARLALIAQNERNIFDARDQIRALMWNPEIQQMGPMREAMERELSSLELKYGSARHDARMGWPAASQARARAPSAPSRPNISSSPREHAALYDGFNGVPSTSGSPEFVAIDKQR